MNTAIIRKTQGIMLSILSRIGELRPAVMVKGLEGEARKLDEIRADVYQVAKAFTPKDVMEQTLNQAYLDILSCTFQVRSAIDEMFVAPSEMGLQKTMLASEALAERISGYLDAKSACELLYGDNGVEVTDGKEG